MKIITLAFILPLCFLLGCDESDVVPQSDYCGLMQPMYIDEDYKNIEKLEGELKINYKISIIEIEAEKKYKIEFEENGDFEYAVSGLKNYQIVLQNFIEEFPYDQTCTNKIKNIVRAKNRGVNFFLKNNVNVTFPPKSPSEI